MLALVWCARAPYRQSDVSALLPAKKDVSHHLLSRLTHPFTSSFRRMTLSTTSRSRQTWPRCSAEFAFAGTLTLSSSLRRCQRSLLQW